MVEDRLLAGEMKEDAVGAHDDGTALDAYTYGSSDYSCPDDGMQETNDDNDGAPLMIPYEPFSDEDDDDSDYSFPDDPHNIDSGWAAECLHDASEDIDFEFVYALHTFVATVEGQANATKGDTMVLLDDSNSYWWLVRVVKDSSIGTFCHWYLGDATHKYH